MLKHFLNIWIFSALAVAGFLAGCSDDRDFPDGPQQSVDGGEVYIRFQMNFANNGIPDGIGMGSRAGEEPETPGTTREDAVSSIDLFVCDAANGNLLYTTALLSVRAGQLLGGEPVGLNLTVPDGSEVRIYAVANMPEKLRGKFIVGRPISDVSMTSDGASYWDVIDEFVPGCAGKQETLQNSTDGVIPMTAQFEYADGSGSVITIRRSEMTKESPMKLKASLCRMVAKIHVVVTRDDVLPAYARARILTGDTETDMGWINLSDVRYIPNGSNKSTYVFPHTYGDGTAYPKYGDLNMDLSKYAKQRGTDLYFDEDKWTKDFSFYNGKALYNEMNADASHFADAESYDEARLANTQDDNDNADRYTKGMYCLENYFDIPAVAGYGNLVDAIPMVTHVSIAAKLVPKWIVVCEDFQDKMDAFVNEYNDVPTKFRNKYHLDETDFTDADVAAWNVMKETYKDYLTGTAYAFRGFRIIETKSEEDALDFLNWSLKYNMMWSKDPADFEKGKFPDGTFYSYDRRYDDHEVPDKPWQQHFYLTVGAVLSASATDENIAVYSVQHVGGWGYYYTYLNQTGETFTDVPSFKASQVTRNTYYIVTVGNFGSPGGSVTDPELIKTTSASVGWDYCGRGDIYLK